MMKVQYRTPVYQTCDWFQAWISKNGISRLVLVGMPSYTWKESFEDYAKGRGFSVTWR